MGNFSKNIIFGPIGLKKMLCFKAIKYLLKKKNTGSLWLVVLQIAQKHFDFLESMATGSKICARLRSLKYH